MTKIRYQSTIVRMKIVADTNTFIAVALNEPERGMIIRLTEGHDLVSPEVLPFEIGNALTAMLKRGALKSDEVILAWEMVQYIPVDLRRIDIGTALKIATQYNIYAYDAYFLECALNLHSPLLTLDRQMKEIAQKIGIQVME
ncbi:type II toxin-antitoxin system VapC family toxin [Thermodesulfobacteriota bacterium]